MPRQTRPHGSWWPIDAEWKNSVRADMTKAGISPSEMARRIGCGSSAMTVLFREKTKLSRLVHAIHRELGRPSPEAVFASNRDLRRIDEAWPRLTTAQRALVISLVDEFAKSVVAEPA
jgi:hypothetical protein